MAGLSPRGIEWGKHIEGEALYVSDALRRCAGCSKEPTIHLIEKFKRRSQNSLEYSVLCRDCLKEDAEFASEKAQTEAVSLLTKTLAKTMKSRAATGMSFDDVLATTCESMGGHTRTFNLVGEVFNKALVKGSHEDALPAEIDRAISVSATLLKSVAANDKAKGPPVDLADIPEDELFQILMEPARQLIFTNKEFRQQLLNDSDIRKVLLLDAGVSVVETPSTMDGDGDLYE